MCSGFDNKNEGKYIKEYIEYYTALDCDLIIYDNDSDDGTASIVKNIGM